MATTTTMTMAMAMAMTTTMTMTILIASIAPWSRSPQSRSVVLISTALILNAR